MRRPSYRAAVRWVAENDSAGDTDALDVGPVSELITTVLVADLFGVDPVRVAVDVIQVRGRERRAGWPGRRTD
jgi:hypothetical protein